MVENGACSFLRLKFMPFGGPDGGDGGDGGSIYLRADESVNTLVDYRYIHNYKAQNGEKGSGQNCTGRSGEDLYLRVPVGTEIYDEDTMSLFAFLLSQDSLFVWLRVAGMVSEICASKVVLIERPANDSRPRW